ncbi:MAG: SMC family ATPase [Lachnospiraceae bacterium]|nr:SMC family ATPase [Lachnospiraceae bacterium]
MRPIKLTMRAFGSYGNLTTIRFDGLNQNLFLITGDTGAGKTTIFDAIVFALYGETGSQANKKDGIVLQSQFTAYDQEPFVELVFLEKNEEYTVRRVPRHLRLLTRGAQKGSGTREVGGNVSLLMPDGTEYPAKETDRRLEEIIGLTKGQFMQVAMIAQGEFMELLRAKSDEKKVIFRKLFQTDLYQKIEDELGRRRKDKEQEIAAIRAESRTESSHVIIPEDYPDAVGMGSLKEQLVRGEMTALDLFLEALGELCAWLKAGQSKAEQAYQVAKTLENARRNAFTEAHELEQLFAQKKAAELEMAECDGREQEMAGKRVLITWLRSSFEIRGEYQRYLDAKNAAETSQKEFRRLNEALPVLEEALKEAEFKEKEQQQLLERQQSETARTEERVKQALLVLEELTQAIRQAEAEEKAWKAAQKEADSCLIRLEELEAQEKLWRQQERVLADTPEKLALWKNRYETCIRLSGRVQEILKQQALTEKQKRESKRAMQEYLRAEKAYLDWRNLYEGKRQIFLQEQAGILAESLKEQQPCPVCGSLEHPHPALRGESAEKITRETLEELQGQVDERSEEQKKRSAQSHAAAELLKEKQETLSQELAKLAREMEEAEQLWLSGEETISEKGSFNGGEMFPGENHKFAGEEKFSGKNHKFAGEDKYSRQEIFPEGEMAFGEKTSFEEVSPTEIMTHVGESSFGKRTERSERITVDIETVRKRIASRRAGLEEEKKNLDQNLILLKKLRQNLDGMEEKKQTLRERSEAAKTAESEARARQIKAAQTQKNLESSLIYPTRWEAERVRSEAQEALKKQEALSREASGAAVSARKKRDQTAALILKYQQEIPGREEQRAARWNAYQDCMEQKKLTEEQWMELVRTHSPEEEKKLQEEVDRHAQRKTAARSRIEAASENIDGRQEPDLDALQEDLQQAEAAAVRAQDRLTRLREDGRVNEQTRKILNAGLEKRRKILEDYTRLDGLYRLVSGNVKDGRMDLETFVQRYYMKRILRAANRRFLEMSGGQFELRLVEAEKAGKGKNRGLDLMVYSTVTGKEREVRTLSGGESFMAALSLALGMADQIQASTAAVHLDMMFIDEGFGSLDEHSRNQAVRVLREMAGGDRLTGIISHVTELKQEIDDQLIVTRDETGSHVRWQIS